MGAFSAVGRARCVAELTKRHPTLHKVEFQDSSGPVLAGDCRAKVRETAREPCVCYYCGRPITERGYYLPEAWDAFEACGIDPAPLVAYLKKHLPLPERAPGIPEGRAATDYEGALEMEHATIHTNAKTCQDGCVLTQLVEKNLANKSQCMAWAQLQARMAGVTNAVPAPWKGMLEQHGGHMRYADFAAAVERGDRFVPVPAMCFRQVQPAYQVYNVRDETKHAILYEKHLRDVRKERRQAAATTRKRKTVARSGR